MKTLVEAYYYNILKSNKMFFRKAETGISDLLMYKIDRIKLENNKLRIFVSKNNRSVIGSVYELSDSSRILKISS